MERSPAKISRIWLISLAPLAAAPRKHGLTYENKRNRDPYVDAEVRTTLDFNGEALTEASFLWTDKLRSPENEHCEMGSRRRFCSLPNIIRSCRIQEE